MTPLGEGICTCDEGYAGETCDEGCMPGYHDQNGTCVVDDSCGLNTCNEHGDCNDTAAGPICTCGTGYDGKYCDTCATGYSIDGIECVDTDECAENIDSCDTNATCTNKPGSYACECNAGFWGDGLSCSPLTDCSEDPKVCDANAACMDVEGAFLCVCNVGFLGDGSTCTDSLNVFLRYIFEQLHGLPQPNEDVPSDVIVELFKAFNVVNATYHNEPLTTILKHFIPTYAGAASAFNDMDTAINRFVSTRFLFSTLNTKDFPEYTFWFNNWYSALALGPLPPHAPVSLNTPKIFTRTAADNNAFKFFLTADINALDIDPAVSNISVSRDLGDEFINAQVILIKNDDSFSIHQVVTAQSAEGSIIIDHSNIKSVYLIIYVTNYNPITSHQGEYYSVSVTGS